MASFVETRPENVQALVQLLRGRSYEEIRERMYDNPPGSPWWTACKIELEIRNGEQVAAGLTASSKVLERLKTSTEHFEQLTETLCLAAQDMSDVVRSMKESGQRLEIAIYAMIGVTVVQMFCLAFQVFGKR